LGQRSRNAGRLLDRDGDGLNVVPERVEGPEQLVEAEITARDESNARNRMRAAAFPVVKTLDEFDVAASSIPNATFDYLASLKWIRAKENTTLIGPAGTGKSHVLVALGVAAVEAGHRVRYFTAAELVEPSTEHWPTTRSAGSSTPCSATT
jgi:DNA replication protein DnaC